jgi:hypothetical protein
MAEIALERLLDELQQRFLGKFRGKVVDNSDPLKRGSVEVLVPAVLGETSVWALPCVPYAGPQVGLYAIPPVGAGVWVEFEGGDTGYPIWTGCFWAEDEIDASDADPGVFFFRTPAGFIRMKQADGSIEIETDGGTSIVMNATEIKVDGKSIKHAAAASATELGASGFDAMSGALTVR